MNRQRILLIVGGCIVALLAGRTVVGFYRDALDNRRNEIASLKRGLDQIKFQKAEAEQNATEWRKVGGQTLSMDPDEVMRRLRDDLFDLTKKTGLEKEKVDLNAVQPWGKNGIRGLTCQVSAEGDMQ